MWRKLFGLLAIAGAVFGFKKFLDAKSAEPEEITFEDEPEEELAEITESSSEEGKE